MKLKATLALLSLLTLFAIYALPTAYAYRPGMGSGPFNIRVTAGNWDLLIIDIQFTRDGTPVGPLYNVMEEISQGTTKTIGPFRPGDDPNSLEIIYYFGGTTHVYIVPSDWAGKGLELNKSYTLITAIGEPLTYPLINDPEGDTTIMLYSPPPPVGGVWVPVDRFGLLAPYIALASTILVATAATAIYVKRGKKQ